MTINAIAAASENNVIGKNNQLPWRLPADLRYFKNTTWGMPLIMGRKTFESVNSPLPGRVNIVITRSGDWKREGVIVSNSLEKALEFARSLDTLQIFISGGAEIFRQAFGLLDRIYITRIHAEFEGDAFFPEIPPKNWKLVKADPFEADEKNPYAYTFEVWERKTASPKA